MSLHTRPLNKRHNIVPDFVTTVRMAMPSRRTIAITSMPVRMLTVRTLNKAFFNGKNTNLPETKNILQEFCLLFAGQGYSYIKTIRNEATEK